MAELITSFMIWIAGQTAFAIPQAPRVVLLPYASMSELAYQRRWQPSDDVRGLYDRHTGTLYLRDDWRSTELRSRAVLLHELVHHMQASNPGAGEERCPAEREVLAYELALKWLREQGADDPYAVLNTDEFTIRVLSMCPD